MVIPIIDCHNDVLAHGNEIFTAIETVGFVYLLNCGIDSQLVIVELFYQISIHTTD